MRVDIRRMPVAYSYESDWIKIKRRLHSEKKSKRWKWRRVELDGCWLRVYEGAREITPDAKYLIDLDEVWQSVC